MSEKRNIEQRVKLARTKLDMNQEAFAKHMGYARNYISMIESGRKTPGPRFLKQLETVENGLLTTEHIYPQRAETIMVADRSANPNSGAPLISWASAGKGAAYEDQGMNVERIPTMSRDPHTYCLTLEGESMEPKFFRGDILVVAPSREARNGDLVVVRTIKDEVYFKVYHWTGHARDPVKLTSFNPAFPVIELRRQDVRFVQPVHSVIRLIRKD